MQQIDKITSAKEQLIVAIRLFFEDASAPAVHTLTRAAHEILDALCVYRKFPGGVLRQGLMQYIKPEYQNKVLKQVNEARNYFKHGDKDPEGILTWQPEVTEFFLWDAICLYKILMGKVNDPEIVTYMMWFRIHHSDLWENTPEPLDTLFSGAREEFAVFPKKKFFDLSLIAYREAGAQPM
jgi:hypothetical protein